MIETASTASVTKHEKIEANCEKLMEMVKPTEELSATAVECLNASGLRWAQRIASGQ